MFKHMKEEPFIADPPLTAEEQTRVEKLSEAEIELIDHAILSNITYRWRKMAMVIGLTMTNYTDRVLGIPDTFYASRIRKLVENGQLESTGNLAGMRFSEVRLCQVSNSKA